MKLVFEINHPAQAHLFKHLIKQLKINGHKVVVFTKSSTIIASILEESEINYINLGKKGNGLIQKGLRQLLFIFKILKANYKQQFNLGVGVSVSLAFLSKFTNVNVIILDDDDKKATPCFANLTHKKASVLMRPESLLYEGNHANVLYYRAYHEIAYLHPKYFIPDPSILQAQNLTTSDTYFLIRLVGLKAHHDKDIKGLQTNQLNEIVTLLKPYGKILITNELNIDPPPSTEGLKITPSKIHHLMAFARLVISDGQTMCSEAACLGIPSVRINDFAGRISYLEEQEKKWKLTFGFKPSQFQQALSKIYQILHDPPEVYKERSSIMWSNMINLTDFLFWFIENYPTSARIMKDNSDYQYNFR